ncbi:methylglutaconyl-CoA hydratase [Tangfeifania diversioriginum]|uniref:Methylglutaconyl-CoA hydratase n=1 Tax=Tangfeifania diversioriginum TaxID=1168035 RepID=A0A1M6J678_9BACT|nr:enoyl-CoA hydratase-related protein [Tangfeifania diversioriginum]SHJ42214.1 methylglutaconyl-CoA hydratase [Tangfeifania diversioriginum]
MKNLKYITVKIDRNRADLILNRPDKHNALNPELIGEFRDALKSISRKNEIHFLVISGKGKSFCAGADISWLASAAEKSIQKNREEYLQIPGLLKELRDAPQITIAAVHGNVLGGANGILSACDFVIAEKSTVFAFGEIKLGIIPATIMPFVAQRLSVQHMKKLMYSGSKFLAPEAKISGLVDFISSDGERFSETDLLIKKLSSSSPNALRACKNLLHEIETGKITTTSAEKTTQLLAQLTHSEEGREGLQAFLEKRKPSWNNQITNQD